jgi:hypothetical protein
VLHSRDDRVKTTKNSREGERISTGSQGTSEGVHRLRIESVLHLMDSPGERLDRVPGKDGYGALRENPPSIVLLVHEMNGRAGVGDSRFENGLMNSGAVHPLPPKIGEKCRVQVEDSPWIAANYRQRDEAQIPRKKNEVDLLRIEGFE